VSKRPEGDRRFHKIPQWGGIFQENQQIYPAMFSPAGYEIFEKKQETY
jgi:hypothetical protein